MGRKQARKGRSASSTRKPRRGRLLREVKPALLQLPPPLADPYSDPELKRPIVRLTPYAFSKLTWMRDREPYEVGLFCISSVGDPLLIEDLVVVKQQVTSATVAFDDNAVREYIEKQYLDHGRQPQEVARIWAHTHPGFDPTPSGTDRDTFESGNSFGRCDWAVMLILGGGGKVYAELRFNAGPKMSIEVPAAIEWTSTMAEPDLKAWAKEYDENVSCPRGRRPTAFPSLPYAIGRAEEVEEKYVVGSHRSPWPWEKQKTEEAHVEPADTEDSDTEPMDVGHLNEVEGYGPW